ncbi:acetyl-CoA synthetase-like protein [Aspergillus eucalypticola CBS 122712]|uniref:Acetyl-CoA synthetase-like protein n=1 Tax=Aspergillus eucalypticola (strain CBS 122712 / IBT 29274) TaxID=1448314 RepID=A0A317VE81_ASPEC|nr:acetyl-CoA synthetase-like protein [Aspergillus eucalypticola CBS 122712]PWY71318.1 acetyl-CoA synthetase-like protein [Aspergillus eucalypticola CBS 122712]
MREVVRSDPEHQSRSAWEQLAEAVERHPDYLALICAHQRSGLYGLGDKKEYGQWSFGELYEGIIRLSASLELLGLSSDCLLFVILGNSLEHVLTTWAGYRLGCIHVSVHPNTLSNSVEARHVVQTVLDNRPSSKAAVFVQDKAAAEQFDQLFPQLDVIKIVIGHGQPVSSSWTSFDQLMQSRETSSGPSTLPPSREISIFFSSGTTSLPKPCKMDVPAWISSLSSGSTLGLVRPGDRLMSLVPCSHVLGYMGQMFALTHGATLVYPSYLAFDPHTTIDTLRNVPCKYIVMVSALVHAFISADLSSKPLPPIDTVIFSGMTLSTAVAKEFQSRVGTRAIENLYGMTEGAFCATGPVEDLDSISRDGFLAAGRPMTGSTLRLCAPNSTEPLAPGVAGEVHYSGYQTARGYLGVQSDSFYIDANGCCWYKTGDQAIMYEPNGLVYPVGRYKDLIIRGGKNISPSAIEAVLNQDPELHQLDPQAVPLPDAVAGEVPVIIVNREIAQPQVQHIMHLILTHMGAAYVPDKVIPIQTLGATNYPRTTSGKVQKVNLAALMRQYAAAQSEASVTLAPSNSREIRKRVVQLWADVLAATTEELDVKAALSERVDSITLMRVHSRASKLTGRHVPFAAWASAKTIADQILLLETADGQPEDPYPAAHNDGRARAGGPALEDMVHLMGDGGGLSATQVSVQQAIARYRLTWDDVEDIFPATDFQHIMRQAHLIDYWEFFVCIHTRSHSVAELRKALEVTLPLHPMLRSFVVQGETSQTLLVTVRPSQSILKRCVVDYGEVATLADVHDLVVNFPQEHRIALPGPLFCGLMVYVNEIKSAVLVADFCHSVMDATYHEIFEDDLELALSGQPLRAHASYKAWNESYYLLQDALASRPAFEYHLSQMQQVPDGPVALWPTPSRPLRTLSGQRSEGLYLLEFQLPALMSLHQHHPTLMTSVVLKTALALLAIFHTKHSEMLLLNVEAARGRFPFLPSSFPREGPLDGARVAGPTLTGNVERITYDPNETVLQLLYRAQAQQALITRYANAPWRRILEDLPRMKELYPAVADHLIFNWTGTTTFKADDKRRLHEHIQRQEIFFQPTCGLMVDAGASGKDGTDLCVSLTGAVANNSPDWIRDIAQGLQKITTWLTQEENWGRPVRFFSVCL